MDDLIAKLEAAESGSRELDGEVLRALGYVYHMDFGSGWYARPGDSKRVYGDGASQVTTSLDAALALADRIRWRARSMDASIEGRFSWCLQSLDPRPGVDEETGAVMSGIDFRYGAGKTPALALCIAVLKATQEKSNG